MEIIQLRGTEDARNREGKLAEPKYFLEKYYSVIKKNAFESVLLRWMKPEPIIQSEVSQKEKCQYSILTHVYMEFRKMVMMALCKRHQKRYRY